MFVGILLALIVALLTGIRSVYTRIGARETDEYVSAWAVRAFALPAIILAVLYDGIPPLDPAFYPLILVTGTLGTAATVLTMRAYKESDASLITPLTAISPALVLITEPLVVGDVASPIGIVGVLLLVSGAYFLERSAEGNLLEPFRKLAQNRGVQFILGVVIIHGITAPIDKVGINVSAAVFWTFALHIVLSTFLFVIMAYRTENWTASISNAWKPLLILGVLSGVSSVLQMVALTETLVVYVTGIKRLSIPLGVVLAHYMFADETNLRGRLVGSAIMVVGTILVTLA